MEDKTFMLQWLMLMLTALMLFPFQAAAETLVLKNGNEISGVIEAIDDEKITINVPGTGSITFAKAEVLTVEEDNFASVDYTDALYLKNGNVILGDIQDRKGDELLIDVPDTGLLTFREDEILTIEQVSREQAAELHDRQTVAMMPTSFAYEEESPKNFAEQLAEWVQNRITEGGTITDKRQISTNIINLVAEIGMWLVVAMMVIAIYHAIVLHTLAGRTGNGGEWMAWVPLVHIYLACEIGGRPPWWILLYLIGYVGAGVGFGLLMILPLVADVFTWWGIAQARGKPGPLGILAIIFPLNLLMIGYLAFSPDKDPGMSKNVGTTA